MVELNVMNFITIGIIAMIFAWALKLAIAKAGI